MLISTEFANNIFEQPWWLDIVAENQWVELLSKDDKGNILGRLPVITNKKGVFVPPMTQTVGMWINPQVSNDYGAQKRVIQDLISQIPKVKDTQIALAPENKYILPFRWAGYSLEPRFTYRINDLSNVDDLYNSFNKTAKKNIKAARNKVRIVDDLEVDVLFELLDKTFETQNRRNPMPKDIIRNIIDTCEENALGKYYAAVDNDGNVHSCAYFVYDDNVCYYLLGASDPKFRTSGAQSLIIWEAIKFASENSKVFDFEGSMIEGIENFFRQFASECIPYYVVQKRSFINKLKDIIKPYIKRLLRYK